MPSSLSQASIPAFKIGLQALSGLLDKAAAHAEARKIDPGVLIGWRLAPDMFPFARQVQIAADMAKTGSARLAGIEAPSFPDVETTFPELKERLSKTMTFLDTIEASSLDASSEREITFPLGPQNKGTMQGAEYLHLFVVPNFYFHLTTAYAILRHCGVPLEKRDFVGAIPLTIT